MFAFCDCLWLSAYAFMYWQAVFLKPNCIILLLAHVASVGSLIVASVFVFLVYRLCINQLIRRVWDFVLFDFGVCVPVGDFLGSICLRNIADAISRPLWLSLFVIRPGLLCQFHSAQFADSFGLQCDR